MYVYTAVPIIVVVDYQMQLFTIFQIIWNQFFVLFCFVLFCFVYQIADQINEF